MPVNAYRGGTPLPRPAMLDRPDPLNGGPWFVGVNVEDYLLDGNSICMVTARGFDGWPLAVQWWPASWWFVQWMPPNLADVRYYLLGNEVPANQVIHVKRGADRFYPVRGVGVVEENLGTLNRVAMESEYESSALSGGAVPSVAVIAPNADDDPGRRRPGEIGLDGEVRRSRNANRCSSPTDPRSCRCRGRRPTSQLNEARHQSLTDVANMFNIDGYWLGSPVAGMTYRTAGPQYQQILRTSLEPVLADFEAVWSQAWLPRGQTVHFDRNQLFRDDLADDRYRDGDTGGRRDHVGRAKPASYMDLPAAQGDPTAALGLTGPPQDTRRRDPARRDTAAPNS